MTRIDGAAYDPALDEDRLKTQMGYVHYALCVNVGWLTVKEICDWILALFHVHAPEPSVSAQVRNLRKHANGGYQINGRYRKGTRIYEYRLVGQVEGLFDD